MNELLHLVGCLYKYLKNSDNSLDDASDTVGEFTVLLLGTVETVDVFWCWRL